MITGKSLLLDVYKRKRVQVMIKRKLTIILAVLMMMLMLPFHSFAQEDIPDSSETAQTENEVVHPDGWDGQMYYKNGQPVKGVVYIKGK